jgi:MtN3 and saliva related transmembrane protein
LQAIAARAQRAVRRAGTIGRQMHPDKRQPCRMVGRAIGKGRPCYHRPDRKEGLMEETLIGMVGTAGTILSTVSLMPQVARTWRTRSAADISAAWLVTALLAMAIWILYGSLIDAPAIVLVNILCSLQCAYILFVKLRCEWTALARRS